MDKHVKNIANRLSLRTPQRESLKILARLTEIIPLCKEHDLAQDLAAIASEYPSVKDFERDFPSLCFSLATGVGKTRLMGAFIAYLKIAKGIKNFFVLAPNLTIYNKLIADFRPGTPKYVFKGLSEFAIAPPNIITGDSYESGFGVRGKDLLDREDAVHINIFNIAKISSEMRGDKAPRIKRLRETLGESYFEYLASLPDLVVLMDESHRYRASAGIKAINALNPVLGLELTATPQQEVRSKSIPFKNVIYDYPLHKAIDDGFVKEPAIATRENFNAKNYTEEKLETIKLRDGICIHEAVKTDLKLYADNYGKPYVKPFMLVVAQDTTHAEKLMEQIKSDEFYQGRYKDRVITVHSAQRGEEKDETVERLLSVENPDNPTEIVIHVNMLKEGWDVTNLYTIVPLRAANSRTLVEQSIGRGLRLPYGERTGVAAVDRLTIAAHDRFDDIIRDANDKKSIFRARVVIGRDIDVLPKKSLEIKSNLDALITGQPVESVPGLAKPTVPSPAPEAQTQAPLFRAEEKESAAIALEIIKEWERLPTSRKLKEENMQQEIVRRVEARMKPKETELDGITAKPDVETVVDKVVQAYIANTIDIPRIIVTPKDSQNYTFEKFTLNLSGIGRFNPVEPEILIHHPRTAKRERLQSDHVLFEETRPEDHIVSALIDFDDISYDHHANMLYDLAGQMVAYIRSDLNDEKDVRNVLQYVLQIHRETLANEIHTQMQDHYKPGSNTEYDVTVTRGFSRPKSAHVTYGAHERIRYFRDEVEDRSQIRVMLFGGFKKFLYPVHKFDSDTERQFAVLLEDEEDVLKWFKPAREDIKIYYAAEHTYEPDFVVETTTLKLLCETKREKDLKAEDVKEKARAAKEWCEKASQHEQQHGGKPWQYILIPHNAIRPSSTLSGLMSEFSN